MTYREVLHNYFGYNDFRPLQEEIICSIGAGHDTLALMPTGGGKSLCFQVPALAQEGLCLVVTPLVALMKDQVENLRRREVKAVAVYTGMTHQEIQAALAACQFGDYKFLYVSPERLESTAFRQRLVQLPVSMIAVDEAHCISQWGYDFRPSYLRIAQIRQILRQSSPDGTDVPILALTATATPDVIDDIQDKLEFREHRVFRKSFLRSNLSYVVRQTDNKPLQLLRILHNVPGSSVVYVRNRKRTKEISDFLNEQGISATYYHAGLGNQEKDLRQRLWKNYGTTGESVRCMVATNAFGMGIDKPDVRTVIHMDLPDTLEAYFQEAGRAGRDGKQAYAVLLYHKDDPAKLRKRVADNYPERTFIKRVYEALGDYFEVALGYGLDHTFVFPFEQFCAEKHLPLLPAFSAIQILSQAGYLAYTDETETSPRVHILCSRDDLYKEQLTDKQDAVVHYLLRHCEGIFSDPVYINESCMADELHIPVRRLNQELIAMAQQRVLQYIPRRKTPYITFTHEREILERLNIPASVYEKRLENYTSKLNAMLEYARQTQFCRSQLLLSYFGENDAEPCGQCDVCRSKQQSPTEEQA